MRQSTDPERVRGAMRSGEWLRTQWIARTAFELGTAPWKPEHAARIRRALQRLETAGQVESRPATEQRSGRLDPANPRSQVAYTVPRTEWRLVPQPE